MDKTIAKFLLHGAGRMKKAQRRDIANWLRKEADHLEKQGGRYTNHTFTARYFA